MQAENQKHALCPVGSGNRWYSGAQIRNLKNSLDILYPVLEWAENFLAHPHKDLGRTGDVCPFVGEALARESLHITLVRLKESGEARFGEIESIVLANREQFIAREQGNGSSDPLFNALIMIFPDVTEEEAPLVIDGVQKKLKPQFVQDGLMLGEFHNKNESPGLRNPDFRPLRCPIPLLAIRHMVESDLPFMSRMYDSPELRMQFLTAYLNFLGPVLTNGNRARAESALIATKEELATASR
jgi:hypothetical protein